MASDPRAWVGLSCFWLLSCGADKAPGAAGAPGDSGGDPADCTVDDSLFVDLQITEGAIPTIGIVKFNTSEALVTSVSWVDEAGDSHATAPDAAATSHRFVLVGIQSTADITFQVHASDAGEPVCSTPASWSAGALSADLPVLALAGDPIGQFTATPLFTEDGNIVTVIDGHGKFVWANAMSNQVWHTRFRSDGAGLYFNRQAPTPNDVGSIDTMDWEGNTSMLVSWTGMHSDFVLLPEGGFAALVYDVRTLVDEDGNERNIIGDGIIEFDEVGNGRVIWSVFDSFEPDLSVDWATVSGTDMEDWSHLNGLTYDEERALFYIPMGAINGVLAVDRLDGSLAFSVSGKVGDIWLDSVDTISNPHSFARVRDDNYVVFNRRAYTDDCSEAIWFDVDFLAGSATLTDTYAGTECRTVTYLGQAAPMADGGALIVWTTSGILERLDAAGAPFWTVTSSLGGAFGYSDVADSLYGSGD